MQEAIDTKHGKLIPMSEEQLIDNLRFKHKKLPINTQKVGVINLQPKPNLPDFSIIKQKKDGEVLEELKEQTGEVKKLRYENIKLNAQLTTANKLNNETNSKVGELKSEVINIKDNHLIEIERLKKEARFANIKSSINGLIVGVVGTLISTYLISLLF